MAAVDHDLLEHTEEEDKQQEQQGTKAPREEQASAPAPTKGVGRARPRGWRVQLKKSIAGMGASEGGAYLSAGSPALRFKGVGKNDVSIAMQAFRGAAGAVPYAREMEQKLGADFSAIKAYMGPEAQEACDALGAEAFTYGDRIAFKETKPSRRVVIHELTHAKQQGSAKPLDGGERTKAGTAKGQEEEAERAELMCKDGASQGQQEEEATRAEELVSGGKANKDGAGTKAKRGPRLQKKEAGAGEQAKEVEAAQKDEERGEAEGVGAAGPTKGEDTDAIKGEEQKGDPASASMMSDVMAKLEEAKTALAKGESAKAEGGAVEAEAGAVAKVDGAAPGQKEQSEEDDNLATQAPPMLDDLQRELIDVGLDKGEEVEDAAVDSAYREATNVAAQEDKETTGARIQKVSLKTRMERANAAFWKYIYSIKSVKDVKQQTVGNAVGLYRKLVKLAKYPSLKRQIKRSCAKGLHRVMRLVMQKHKKNLTSTTKYHKSLYQKTHYKYADKNERLLKKYFAKYGKRPASQSKVDMLFILHETIKRSSMFKETPKQLHARLVAFGKGERSRYNKKIPKPAKHKHQHTKRGGDDNNDDSFSVPVIKESIPAKTKSYLMRKLRTLSAYKKEYKYPSTAPEHYENPLLGTCNCNEIQKKNLKKAAKLYQAVADGAIMDGSIGLFNKYIRLSKSRGFVKNALMHHKPVLVTLLYTKAKFQRTKRNFDAEALKKEKKRLGYAWKILNKVVDKSFLAEMASVTATKAVFSVVGFAKNIYKALCGWGAAYTARKRLSFAMGVAYGTVGLALGIDKPRRHRAAKGYESTYYKGVRKGQNYYLRFFKDSKSVRVAAAMELITMQKMGGSKSFKKIWGPIRNKYLNKKMYHVTNAMWKDADWPPY